MRRGEPFIRLERETEERLSHEIYQVCHPAIFEIAALWKQSIEGFKALGPNPPRELLAEIDARARKGLAEIKGRYSGPVDPPLGTFATDIIFSAGQNEEGRAVGEFLHWERHKIPLSKDLERQRARDGAAARRVLRTASDYQGLRCDGKRPKPFKGDLEHSNMFDVLWGFGVEKLTPVALAYFFDCFCPCGTEHEPENLKKQRDRYSEAFNEALK